MQKKKKKEKSCSWKFTVATRLVVLFIICLLFLPMPHMSQRTISLGKSELSFLHLMQIMSVVVSSTAKRGREEREGGGVKRERQG